jgi:hypothetical protein
MIYYPLYIDPGTGSALFSIAIGIAATLYFLFRALVLRIKTGFSRGKTSARKNYTSKYVIYNEGKQYWDLFKPVIEEFENNKTEIQYLTSASDDPVFENDWQYVKPEFIGEGNKAFAYLNFLSAEVVLMTTPGLDVYQLKRSKSVRHYSHVIHGTTDASTYRLFGLDYFDSVLLTGGYQGDDIRLLEKLRNLPEKQIETVGCSYLDEYLKKIRQIPKEENHSFTVLVSPSWGVSSLLTRYGEKLLDPLSKSGFNVIIRPHPQSVISEKPVLERLQTRYKDCENFIWNFDRENIYCLNKADIMISDFSGIIFDYLFLCDKPVLYVNHHFDRGPYDVDDLDIDHELWQFKTLKKAGIKLTDEDFPGIAEIIKNASDSEALSAARKEAKEAAWQYIGEAGKRTFDFMTKIAIND